MSCESKIEKLLQDFNCAEALPARTPLPTNPPDESIPQSLLKPVPYLSLVASLLYLARRSRPDILFPVWWLSTHNKDYDKRHWKAAKQVLRYLKGTRQHSINYQVNHSNKLTIFVDASHKSKWSPQLRSVEGILIFWEGVPVFWDTIRNNNIIAQSTFESELRAVGHALHYARHIIDLIHETIPTYHFDVDLHCDNLAVVNTIIKQLSLKRKNIHLLHTYQTIQDIVKCHNINVMHIASADQRADILTKPESHRQLCEIDKPRSPEN